MNATPFTPEECLESVERFQANEAPKRIAIEVSGGLVELPLWEAWYADTTNTIYLSVRIPDGWQLTKI